MSQSTTARSPEATTPALPVRRRVEHMMGLPVSLALRGRNCDDDAAATAWGEALALLGDVDRVFSTYRSASWISRLGRGEVWLEDCRPEVSEVLALGEQARRESGGAFDVRRRARDGPLALDPSGVVKGWAIAGAAAVLSRLPDTDVCLSGGGDMVCRTAAPGSSGWRVGIEEPFDPSRIVAVMPVRNGAVALVTVLATDLTWADIDATAAEPRTVRP